MVSKFVFNYLGSGMSGSSESEEEESNLGTEEETSQEPFSDGDLISSDAEFEYCCLLF